MKAVILAGGFGTRLSEETVGRPKPMVEVGGKPILWHIMKLYSFHGVKEFVICCGYKGYVIKEYFANYFLHMSDITFDLARNATEIHHNSAEDWKVTVVDTGEKTMTGGRLKRIAPFLDGQDFCFTYGDGLADVDIGALIRFHKQGSALATVTAVEPPARFGALLVRGDNVRAFQEKPSNEGWVNGGFFVLSPQVLDYVEGDQTIWEREPLERLAGQGQLRTFRHLGFWQCMDTLRDQRLLEDLWNSGKAPWKVWP